MAENDVWVFSIGTGENDEVSVVGWDGLIDWLNKERARWSWLVPGDGVTDIHNWSTQTQQRWNELINNAASLRSQGHEPKTLLPHLAAFQGLLLASESSEGALVQGIQERHGPEAAMIAYMFLKRAINVQSATTPNQLLGMLMTALPDFGPPAQIAERLSTERRNYRQAITTAIHKLDVANNERSETFKDNLSRGRAIAAKLLRRRRDNWKQVQGNWQSQALDAVNSIKAVENTYLEAMKLQAPVQYWRDKANDHLNRKKDALSYLRWFFPLAIVALIAVFGLTGRYLLNNPPAAGSSHPVALYVVITGGLALLSTMLFWVGRLLTKLYLSEHHLANDASERAIMTQTYLALTGESAAADADRSIILNALFRSTPDGIVKDEGPSDLSIQGLLSRLVAR